MTKEEYYRIRDSVYKNAGMDKFDFDLMMCRVVMKAVEVERKACAKEIEIEICDELEDEAYCILVTLLARIRARGQE